MSTQSTWIKFSDVLSDYSINESLLLSKIHEGNLQPYIYISKASPIENLTWEILELNKFYPIRKEAVSAAYYNSLPDFSFYRDQPLFFLKDGRGARALSYSLGSPGLTDMCFKPEELENLFKKFPLAFINGFKSFHFKGKHYELNEVQVKALSKMEDLLHETDESFIKNNVIMSSINESTGNLKKIFKGKEELIDPDGLIVPDPQRNGYYTLNKAAIKN